jgi:hypothetical protein
MFRLNYFTKGRFTTWWVGLFDLPVLFHIYFSKSLTAEQSPWSSNLSTWLGESKRNHSMWQPIFSFLLKHNIFLIQFRKMDFSVNTSVSI